MMTISTKRLTNVGTSADPPRNRHIEQFGGLHQDIIPRPRRSSPEAQIMTENRQQEKDAPKMRHYKKRLIHQQDVPSSKVGTQPPSEGIKRIKLANGEKGWKNVTSTGSENDEKNGGGGGGVGGGGKTRKVRRKRKNCRGQFRHEAMQLIKLGTNNSSSLCKIKDPFAAKADTNIQNHNYTSPDQNKPYNLPELTDTKMNCPIKSKLSVEETKSSTKPKTRLQERLKSITSPPIVGHNLPQMVPERRMSRTEITNGTNITGSKVSVICSNYQTKLNCLNGLEGKDGDNKEENSLNNGNKKMRQRTQVREKMSATKTNTNPQITPTERNGQLALKLPEPVMDLSNSSSPSNLQPASVPKTVLPKALPQLTTTAPHIQNISPTVPPNIKSIKVEVIDLTAQEEDDVKPIHKCRCKCHCDKFPSNSIYAESNVIVAQQKYDYPIEPKIPPDHKLNEDKVPIRDQNDNFTTEKSKLYESLMQNRSYKSDMFPSTIYGISKYCNSEPERFLVGANQHNQSSVVANPLTTRTTCFRPFEEPNRSKKEEKVTYHIERIPEKLPVVHAPIAYIPDPRNQKRTDSKMENHKSTVPGQPPDGKPPKLFLIKDLISNGVIKKPNLKELVLKSQGNVTDHTSRRIIQRSSELRTNIEPISSKFPQTIIQRPAESAAPPWEPLRLHRDLPEPPKLPLDLFRNCAVKPPPLQKLVPELLKSHLHNSILRGPPPPNYPALKPPDPVNQIPRPLNLTQNKGSEQIRKNWAALQKDKIRPQLNKVYAELPKMPVELEMHAREQQESRNSIVQTALKVPLEPNKVQELIHDKPLFLCPPYGPIPLCTSGQSNIPAAIGGGISTSKSTVICPSAIKVMTEGTSKTYPSSTIVSSRGAGEKSSPPRNCNECLKQSPSISGQRSPATVVNNSSSNNKSLSPLAIEDNQAPNGKLFYIKHNNTFVRYFDDTQKKLFLHNLKQTDGGEKTEDDDDQDEVIRLPPTVQFSPNEKLTVEEYVAEMILVERFIPKDFFAFYKFVTGYQICNDNLPVSFLTFLNIYNTNGLRMLLDRYVNSLRPRS